MIITKSTEPSRLSHSVLTDLAQWVCPPPLAGYCGFSEAVGELVNMWKHLSLYLVSRKEKKTTAGFGVKRLVEKKSRKAGKIRKYERPPHKKSVWRYYKTGIITEPRFVSWKSREVSPVLVTAFPWWKLPKFRKVDEMLGYWEDVQNFQQIDRIGATIMSVQSLLKRDPSNLSAKLRVEIPKCYALWIIVIHKQTGPNRDRKSALNCFNLWLD